MTVPSDPGRPLAMFHTTRAIALRIIKQNIALALLVMLALVASDLLRLVSLPWGVIGHEGSTLLVTLNGLRLLRRPRAG